MRIQDILTVTRGVYLNIIELGGDCVWSGAWYHCWYDEVPKQFHRKLVRELEPVVDSEDGALNIIIH